MQHNAATWFVDRHSNEARGENIAFHDAFGNKRAITYQQLSAGSSRVAGAFAPAEIHRE